MAEEKEKVGMTDEAIFKSLEADVFIGELVNIMRTGEYLSPVLEPKSEKEVLFRNLTSVEKALVTLHKQSRQHADKYKCCILNQLFWSGIKSDPIYEEADASIENRGMVMRKDWKIVFLPPLTEEEKMEQMHREVVSEALGQILGGMVELPSEHGPFSHGASPFDDIFGPGVHVIRMGRNPVDEENDQRGIFSNLFNRRRQ